MIDDVRIALSRLDDLVAEPFLNGSDLRAPLYQFRRKAVPKRMAPGQARTGQGQVRPIGGFPVAPALALWGNTPEGT